MTPGDTLTIAGGTNATTAMSGDTLTVNVDDAFLKNNADDTTTGLITAKQRHVMNCGADINSDTKVYLPFAYGGTSEQSGTTNYTEFISFVTPCDGYVEFVIARSEYAHGSTVIGLHKASDNTEAPSTTASNTTTVNMSADDIAFKFEGGTGWSFSAGDTLAISFDPTSADVMGYEGGDATFTLVLVLDWNNPLAVYGGGS